MAAEVELLEEETVLFFNEDQSCCFEGFRKEVMWVFKSAAIVSDCEESLSLFLLFAVNVMFISASIF